MRIWFRKICRSLMMLTIALSICLVGCTPQKYPDPDYSYATHKDSDEEDYKTILADLNLVANGNPAIALKVSSYYHMNDEVDLTETPNFGYDLRSCNISNLDLNLIDLNKISFDSNTIWPEILPTNFSPDEVLEYNKNPGLGIRDLHERGIDGSGIGIAIIDQGLFTNHEQYRDNLMLYEEIHCSDTFAQMHGSAVASIAVGKDIGVAPGATLYYIASTLGHRGNSELTFDASIVADCIYRVIEINQVLPESNKIRVISISRGYEKNSEGYKELRQAIKLAEQEGIFVLTTSTSDYYNFNLYGIERDIYSDPDILDSYCLPAWTPIDNYSKLESIRNLYLVPSGTRTYASCSGYNEYEFSYTGGLSWAVPWFAGFYALCCQVRPELTPHQFISAIERASQPAVFEYDGMTYHIGKIVDPVATINLLVSFEC
ncbi:S8/S53 family peptidase [Flavonifractor plautii]|uniref:S8/S53 family peptidase n=1 Tax=Flavonifractor plautii TaxID=292800 RepID=UPI00111EE54A|nr:S8/S53 family peptidase [Flavonifractor plautii]